LFSDTFCDAGVDLPEELPEELSFTVVVVVGSTTGVLGEFSTIVVVSTAGKDVVVSTVGIGEAVTGVLPLIVLDSAI
jgi:hypothetical protein